MNAATMQKAMPGLDATRAQQLVGPCNAAMKRAGVTTPKRAAAFLAQVGHESGSLRLKVEGGGSSKPYAPYFGRGFIQLTHKGNYLAFGKWLAKGDLFVRQPSLVERDEYAWLSAVFYWTIHRLNGFADSGDFTGLTEAINGGLSHLEDRQHRHRICVGLGNAILPEDPDPLRELTPKERNMAQRLLFHRHRMDREAKTGKGPLYRRERLHAASWKATCRAQMLALQADARIPGRGGWAKDNRAKRYQILKAVVERRIK